MAYRKILHVDMDAFFCAVEEQLNPQLKGKAFAVGGSPQGRGVVASCSYPARVSGVRSAMPMARALRLCPGLLVVRGSYRAYDEASRKVMEILGRFTALVEQVSIDEAFLDVSDLPESGLVIAARLQTLVDRELGLPCSFGVATSKLVAKIANNIGKAEHRGSGPPRAIKVVPPGEEAAFLAPLPAQELWGIGPKTAARLEVLGIKTIGAIAAQNEAWLAAHFGEFGHHLHRHARGQDERPVVTFHDTKSISNEVTFSKDIQDESELRECLRGLAEKVGGRLRKAGFCASTVKIKLRWPDFSTHTRQVTLNDPFDQDSVIFEAALGLFRSLWQPGRAVRLLGVGVSGLQGEVYQPSLWETASDRERRLLAALDALRERFGRDVIQRGARLQKDRRGRE